MLTTIAESMLGAVTTVGALLGYLVTSEATPRRRLAAAGLGALVAPAILSIAITGAALLIVAVAYAT